ncbi:MAG: DNA polymerase III subunit epsilon [Pseudomonadota bacterium]
MKHICLDTETTGFDPYKGDRIVEIACVELENYIPTGREYHQYVNPERDMPEGAFKVHGLSEAFLKDYPVFSEISDAFSSFIGDLPLVIHNAKFDMKFLNYELEKSGHTIIPMSRAIDTLAIARSKFPGAPATLDALCKRYEISLESRELHGALIDTHLLAEVFLHLSEGRSPELLLKKQKATQLKDNANIQVKSRPKKLETRLTKAEKEAHEAFVKENIKGEALFFLVWFSVSQAF